MTDVHNYSPGGYLSTACRHGEHGKCRITCKFCNTECVCACHTKKVMENTVLESKIERLKEEVRAGTDDALATLKELEATLRTRAVGPRPEAMRKDGLTWGEYRNGVRWVNGKKTQFIQPGGGVPLDEDPVYGPPTGEY